MLRNNSKPDQAFSSLSPIPCLENVLDSPDILPGLDHVAYSCHQTRQVLTIHDVIFIKYPDFITGIGKTYTQIIAQSLPWTYLVIVNCKSTKQEVISYSLFSEVVTHHASIHPGPELLLNPV
jgi:hypothetical protein